MKLLFFILLSPVFCFAAVDVAFLEVRNATGQVIQLEQNGQFAHIAISYGGGWLHAHPVRGVEIVSRENLERIGRIKSVLRIQERAPLSDFEVRKFLGRPYDPFFSWTDDRIYCSELVAKLLNIQPQPMSFSAPHWPPEFHGLRGRLGLSPDDIFAILKR